jgi:cell division protein FtsW
MAELKAKKLQKPWQLDVLLLAAILILVAFGLLMVFSTTGTMAIQRYGDSYHFLKRQLAAASFGILLLFICYRLHLGVLKKLSPVFFPLALLLLALTLIPGIGDHAGGAQRWINLGIIKLQLGELVKLLFVIFLAGYFERQQARLAEVWKGMLLPLFLALVLCALLMMQPDFGSSAVIVAITMIMSFCSGARVKYLFLSGFVVLLIGTGFVMSSSYRMSRVMNYLNPMNDLKGKGYQLNQSLISVGSGHLMGVGLGESEQKLFFLPAAHTDFIFAVISEELGFVGAVAVLLVFLFVLWRGVRIAMELSDNTFLFTLAVGTTMLLVLPAITNMGVVLGLLPTKGMVLPLLGYGGSNLVCSLVAAGILLALGREARLQRY